MQTDDCFGQVVDALRDNGFLKDTLIICSSDNGTSAPSSKKQELENKGHFPSGDLRGSKADLWDGGHRVPCLVSWPGVVQPASRTDALIGLSDLVATIAQIVDADLPVTAAEDSISFLPILQGKAMGKRRDIIHHSVSGYFAIRRDQWKLLLCPGSGGWTRPRPSKASWARSRRQGKPMTQLYDMSVDPAERKNLVKQKPEIARELRELLELQIGQGRTSPGPRQTNDAIIVVDKHPL